jgi:hypothetical protein
MRLATVLALLLVVRVAYADDDAATGSVEALPSPSRPGHLGGDGPQFVLYLRADGALGEDGRTAVSAALAALARIPGAGVDVFIDPADLDASTLAELLTKPPDEMSRRALLVALARDDLTRVTPMRALHLRRGSGMFTLLPRSDFGASPAVKAMLRRPPGAPFAQRSFFALGDRKLDVASIDALVEADVWHPSKPPRPDAERVLAAGRPLADDLVARVCFALPLSNVSREMLLETLKLYDLGRARLRFELATPAAGASVDEGESTLRRAFARAGPGDRVRLVRLFTQERLPDTGIVAVWLIQTAGVDPAPLLEGPAFSPAKRVVLDPSAAISVTMNGAPVSMGDLRMLTRAKAPSMRQRLAGHP